MIAENYAIYTDAERMATALVRDQERAIEYPLSQWDRQMRYERACSLVNRVRDTVNAEMEKQRVEWVKERAVRTAMIRFWTARYNAMLSPRGSAVIDKKRLIAWVKQIAKTIPTKQARGQVGAWMKEPQYGTVTLDLVGGKLSASFYCAIDGQWGWVSALSRLEFPISEGSFTVTIPFDTFRDFCNLLDDGAIVFRKERDITPLVIEQGRCKTRFKHSEIGDSLTWIK